MLIVSGVADLIQKNVKNVSKTATDVANLFLECVFALDYYVKQDVFVVKNAVQSAINAVILVQNALYVLCLINKQNCKVQSGGQK